MGGPVAPSLSFGFERRIGREADIGLYPGPIPGVQGLQCDWSRGSFTEKVEPTPSSLSTAMVPPWASTICRTM